jgi:hypothetical protein
MFYLIPDVATLDFLNTPQTKDINIVCNGTVNIDSKPDWAEVQVEALNYRADSDSDGLLNSSVINVFEVDDNAARQAINYSVLNYTSIVDWYLPSKDELQTLIDNQSFFAGFPFTYINYWSSTEDTSQGGTNAFSINTSGTLSSSTKTNTNGVRPIRKFTYSEANPPFALGYDLGYGIIYDIDTLTKTIYVGAKEDVVQIEWGTKTTIANASFTNKLVVSVKANDRYFELTGNLNFSLIESPTTSSLVTLTQAGVDADSQAVFLKDVIDNVMIMGAMNDRSYLAHTRRFHMLLLAKRLMQEINYDGLREIRAYEAEITAANKVIPPLDYVEYVRMSYVTPRGQLIPIFVNDKLNISFKYLRDNENNVIVDELGYPLKAQGTRRSTEDAQFRNWEFVTGGQYRDDNYVNALYGMTGGIDSYTGSYRYDPDAKEFLLDNVPEEFTHVILEYVSDPILAEKDSEKLRIHKYFQSTIESGIYYKFIETCRDVPRSEVVRAKQEYYNEFRKAKRRLNSKPDELKQKLNSDIGYNKML